MPHLAHFALATADPQKHVPIGFWMHRGCVPFVSFDQFRNFFWATLKPIVQELWAHGHQTLFYAEGNWDHHLQAFAELPERSIVFHVDQSDPLEVHRVLGRQVLLERRHSEPAVGQWLAGASAPALCADPAHDRPRRRVHPRCQRHHPERRAAWKICGP